MSSVPHLPWLVSFLLMAFSVATGAAESFSSVYLSEVSAGGKGGAKDESGARPGWIELHNNGRSPVNLRGWFLTDTPTNLTKWRFPSYVLLPDKYALVFASGNDRTNDLLHLHTSFSIGTSGGFVALVNPATNIVSQIEIPKLAAGTSFGSVRGEPSWRGVFEKSTPGKANASSGAGFAPEVVFSKANKYFTGELTVALSAKAGASIHFTRDGTLPTTNSPIYSEPLLLTNSAYLRARAYQPGRLPGPPASAAFTRATNMFSANSPLPVLVLNTFGKNQPTSANETFVHVSVFEPVNGRTWLTNPPTLTTRAGFRQRGSSSQGFPQPSFAVEFLNEFNDPQPHSLLGLPADSDWVLYAPNGYDPVLIHNPFVHELSRQMGRYSSRTRFVEVYVNRGAGRLRDSHYLGLYVLEEKIKIGKERVNIDRLSAEDLKAPKVTGGYVLKFDRLGPDESGIGTVFGGYPIVHVEPKEQVLNTPQRAAQRNHIVDYLVDFQKALQGADWRDPEKGYRAYLDVDAAVDFHLLEVLSGNVDAMVLSTYFHKPRGGKLVCGPHWDFDRALGSTDGRDENPRNWNTGPYFGGTWWPRVLSDLDFWQQWVDRWQQLRKSTLATTNLNALVDRLANEIKEVQPKQYAKWGFNPRGGSYQAEIDHMKDWLSNRVDFIDSQLAAQPRFNQLGGNVKSGFMLTFEAATTNSRIYYTLDGSDPRGRFGSNAPTAMLYSNPVPITASCTVVARTKDRSRRQIGGPPVTTPWSAPVPARFEVAPR